jgi:hypothetical protein
MALKKLKIAVGERALAQRIDRILAKKDEQLLKARTGRIAKTLGRYFILDPKAGAIRKNVQLLELGRELKVLAPYEQLTGEAP